MRTIHSKLSIFIFIAASLFLISCNKKIDQVNAIIHTPIDREGTIDRISQAIAVESGMVKSKEVFDYGGNNGKLISILLKDYNSSILIRNISEEECTTKQGDRRPEFLKNVYSVSIYRTSIFNPKLNNMELLKIISLAASRNGSSVVPESEKCRYRSG